MDHHKILYKEQRSHTPRQHNRINREIQEANRNKRRRDRFQDSRNISVSPICIKKEIEIPICPEENQNFNTSQKQNTNSTRLAKIVCNSINAEKLTKQEAFLKRFITWKENKKNIKNAEGLITKKKPFISTVNSSKQTTTSSLVPTGHHEGFRPPVGLENPIKEEAENSKVKGRPSVYTVVPTPPRKQMAEKCTNKYPIPRNILPTTSCSNKISNGPTNSVNTTTKIKTGKLFNKSPADKKSSVLRKSPSSSAKTTKANTVKVIQKDKANTSVLSKMTLGKDLRPRDMKMPPPKQHTRAVTEAPTDKRSVLRKSPSSAAKTTVANIVKVMEKAKTNTPQTTLGKDLRPRDFKMPPPKQATSTVTAAPNKYTGAIAKIKKRAEEVKQINKSSSKTVRACLSQNLKAKKTLSSKKTILPMIKINSKNLLNTTKSSDHDDMVIQTPKDFATVYPFDKFVTSTKIKNSSQSTVNEGLSEIETLNKSSRNGSSAKRNIMQGTTNILQVKESDPNEEKNITQDSEQKTGRKYNFIRYSEKENVFFNTVNNNNEVLGVKENLNVSLEKTPTKYGPEERPANYLSPYVSVTRGKDINQNTSVELRRTLEAVRYFRKQLQDEIDRLHQLCDIWESYKKENLEKIQNANGEDMINVTIGQTRLLTSKKFMQFKGLIDRCEAGATSKVDIGKVGSEDAKPVTSGDLEGFWSMLGIQIDNLEKRFDNLNRWKMNDWEDPDEKKMEIKKTLTKVRKNKAIPAAKAKPKPNSALQQMMRKMQSDMRKNKNGNNDNNDVVVFTSSKTNQQRSANNSNTPPLKSVDVRSPRRLSITVKDRKYFSPAATVISVCSPNSRTFKSTQDSPKLLNHIQKFNETLDSSQCLRKSVLINKASRRISVSSKSPPTYVESSDQKSNCSIEDSKENVKGMTSNHTLTSKSPNSPLPSGGKSILKTPGTAKSRLRNVIFNEKLRVKKFNFMINDDSMSFNAENGEDTQEEELAKSCEEETQCKDNPQRTLTLRNRKVRMRPSDEIVIPKK